ncbi:MAG: hypothetical protein ACYDCC_08650 [Actinomycetota bacterium]
MVSRRLISSIIALATVAVLAPGISHAEPAKFLVGVAARDISPTPAEIAGNNFFMGGYGFGNGRIGTQDNYVQTPAANARYALGVMGDELPNNPFAPWVRAIAIGDDQGHTIVLTDLDNQGTFPAYKPNPSTGATRPYGFDDIRAAAAAAAPGLDARSIVISSDHSHAGQDMTGVWGFVPDEYLKRVKDLAVAAIVDAYTHMQPAILKQSAIETPQPCGPDASSPTRIFNNQFCGGSFAGALGSDWEHSNDPVDAQVRVLRAFHPDDPEGAPFAVLANAAIHATVGGSDNRYVSSDWVSTMSNYIEQEYPGATAVTIVGDVGRTQPNDRSCNTDPLHPGQFLEPLSQQWTPFDVDPRAPDSCPISQFARRVKAWVDLATTNEETITKEGVSFRELFIRDVSDSAILFGLDYGGDLAGAPIARGITPPYLSGGVIGTWVGAYRIGDVLMLAAPGEAYPNIRMGLLKAINTTEPTWIFGLANDQLGYLIAPTPQGYPEPVRRSLLSGDPHDPTTWGPDPIGNDNFFFNVSPTIGDHVMCTMIKGAKQLGFTGEAPAKCAPWMHEVNQSGPGDPTWTAPLP